MDKEPSFEQYRVRAWVQAHVGAIRGLLQGIVILTGAVGLWLIGVGPHSDKTLPLKTVLPSTTTPAVVSLAPLPTASSTSIAAEPPGREPTAVNNATPHSVPAVPMDSPGRGARDGGDTDAPALLESSPDVLTAPNVVATPLSVGSPDTSSQDASSQDASPQDASPQDASPQDASPQDASPQDVPVQVGGDVLPYVPSAGTTLDSAGEGAGDVESGVMSDIVPDVFLSILPTHVPLPAAPDASEINQWVWPVRGEISQGYSSGHRAIDISADQGAIVVVADAGTVVYAKWESSGYGYLVLIDHHNGFASYYAHLYGFYIDVGREVSRGEQIGELGTTGRSTGPHLHFEIRQDGVQRDPLDLLP